MKVELDKQYGKANHNLSRKVRTSMAPGTVVPLLTDILLPGDTYKIDIATAMRTMPTIGPMFGSFELAIDVFTARMSLYNKVLHNNRSSLARNMQNVLLPMIAMQGPNPASAPYQQLAAEDPNKIQIGKSSLANYLGISGLGSCEEPTRAATLAVVRYFPSIFLMFYWETIKEYYANKQEENMYVLSSSLVSINPVAIAWRYESENFVTPPETYKRIRTRASADTSIIYRTRTVVLGHGIRLFSDPETGKLKSAIKWKDSTGGEWAFYAPDNGVAGWYVGGTDPTDPTIGAKQLGVYGGYIYVPEIGTETMLIEWRSLMIEPNDSFTETDLNWFVDSTDGLPTEAEAFMQEFPMENIELMRDKILSQPAESPLVIPLSTTYNQYISNLPYSVLNTAYSQLSASGTSGAIAKQSLVTGRGAGLALKTYKSDRFNAWLNTEFVEELSEAVGVAVTDGRVNLNDFNAARSLYNLEARIAASNQTYKGWIEAAYGEVPRIASEIPVFVGSVTGEILFDEVVSNASTTDEPLGTLAGRGDLRGGGGGITVHAEEPTMLMIVASITPRIGYTDGNEWHTRLQTMDDLHKPEYDGIGYQPLITDEMAAWDTKLQDVMGNGTVFEPIYSSAGKQPAWAEYMTKVDRNYGDFAEKGSLDYMVLNRRYDSEIVGQEAGTQGYMRIKDLSTYIDPRKHNYAFAATGLEAQNFWLHVGFDIKARRKVAARQIPRL